MKKKHSPEYRFLRTAEDIKKKFNLHNYDCFYDHLDAKREEKSKIDGIKYSIIAVVEKKYVDSFFLRDYAKYYVEAFSRTERFTERIHFFLSDLKLKEFRLMIENVLMKKNKNLEKINKYINEVYLGYLVKKPIKKSDDNLVGRTIFRPFLEIDGRKFLIPKIKNRCNLFGIEISFEGLPFHQQDIAVGACASAALWSAQFAIRDWYSVPIRSLAEITEKSYYLPKTPIYPSGGLTTDEINKYLLDINVHFHFVRPFDFYRWSYDELKRRKFKNQEARKWSLTIAESFMMNAIRGYLKTGFPIIVVLGLYKNEQKAKEEEILINQGLRLETGWLADNYHSVVLSGYKDDGFDITEIYLHDDELCPYSKTEWDKIPFTIKNKWKNDYDVIKILSFTIPVHPSIRLSLSILYEYIFTNAFQFIKNNQKNVDDFLMKISQSYMFLYSIGNYKEYIYSLKSVEKIKLNENQDFQDKDLIDFLYCNCPKYVWVWRNLISNLTKDFIYDATIASAEEDNIIAQIEYPGEKYENKKNLSFRE